jgi:hypothetical protein
MLEKIDPRVMFAIAGAIGGAGRGLFIYIKKKRENKKTTFDTALFSDTILKGATAGLAISMEMPINNIGIFTVAIAGAGIDTITKNLGIQIIPILKDLAIKKSKQPTKKPKKE